MRPRNIAFFECLILASLALGVVQSYFEWPNFTQQTSAGYVPFTQLLVFAVMLTLTLLISRRRSNIAKWISVALYLLGLPLYFKMVGEGSVEPGIVQLIQLMLQAIGYTLLFTPQARKWFRGEN